MYSFERLDRINALTAGNFQTDFPSAATDSNAVAWEMRADRTEELKSGGNNMRGILMPKDAGTWAGSCDQMRTNIVVEMFEQFRIKIKSQITKDISDIFTG